jgi:integrase
MRYERDELTKMKRELNSVEAASLDKFKVFCMISANEKTCRKIECSIMMYRAAAGSLSKKPTAEIRDKFLTSIKDKGDAYKIKVYAKKWLKWKWPDFKEEFYTPFKRIKMQKLNDAKINSDTLFTDYEIKALLTAADSFYWRSWLATIAECGARPEELAKCKWQDLKYRDDGTGDISLLSSKTGKFRKFPLKASVIHLRRWEQEYLFSDRRASDYIWPNKDRGVAYVNHFNRGLKIVAKKAGITRNIWSYMFRHTLAKKLYSTLPQSVVEALLGHKNMAATYAHIDDDTARTAMLENIYNIKELKPEEQNEIKKRMTAVEEENKELRDTITKMWERLNNRDGFLLENPAQ